MGMLFDNNEYIECPRCGSKQLTVQEIYAIKETTLKQYIKTYLGSKLECSECGAAVKALGKVKIKDV